jgi:transcriptional regulator with XRE-family HTH domain
MDVELKYLPPEILSVEHSKVVSSALQACLTTYERTQRLPLIFASPSGTLKRYRVRAQHHVAAAAKHLKLDAVWVLVLPQHELPFDCIQENFGPAVAHESEERPTDEPLHKLEEASNYAKAIRRGLSQQAVAKQFGVSRSYVNNALQLTKLDHMAKEAFLSGALSVSQARILSYEKDAERQNKLLAWATKHKVSARALERAIYQKTDITTEDIQLSHLSSRLSERWSSPVTLKMRDQGLTVQANPHKDQLNFLLADLAALDMITDLSWREQGSGIQVMLSFRVIDNAAFSAWLEKLRLTDADDLGIFIERPVGAVD